MRKRYITIIAILVACSLVYILIPKNAFNILSEGEKIESITFGTYFKLGERYDYSEKISDLKKIKEFSQILNSKRLRRTFDTNIFNQAEALSFFVILVDEKGKKTSNYVAINHQGKLSVIGGKSYITDPLLYNKLYEYFEQLTPKE
ncbi:hypothetical protein ACFSO7_16100 [Bacillus sp. CGMCC 1.16607]|uniref:hypothetical protein n=1 Tax=Bacillus sp. CGMCC 1.16607 TaxID=3351842 RepID=UPI003624C12F